MKNTPASILTGLLDPTAEPFLLLKIEPVNDANITLTNLGHDITYNLESYLSDGGLTKLSPPQLTNVADREIYKIELIDFDFSYQTLFNNGLVGAYVTVWLGVNADVSALDIVYKGRVSGLSITSNSEEGTRNAIIECGSPFAALDRTNSRLTDSFYQKAIDPTDTCFNNIFKNTDQIQIRWGKQ